MQRLGVVLTSLPAWGAASAAGPGVPAVEAAGIYKRFGSTQALRGVDLALRAGQCLGLVGRNGAGKSTLVSILSGVQPQDDGEVRFDGSPAPPPGATGAWRRKIATVFQHSMVVPGLTVAENVFLGRPPLRRGHRLGIVDWRQMREQTRQIMAEWGFQINANEPCANLTVEQRQVVEIARALAAGTRCLLLDEPTAALERGAVQRLFERIRQLTDNGVAVLYISHHLEEVFEICQDVAVVRDGQLVLAAPTASLATGDLVTAMVGEQAGGEVGRWRGACGAGPFPAPSSRTNACAFQRTWLSSDFSVGVAAGCPVWMVSWQAWQTRRVLRRRLAMSSAHPGCGCPGVARSASLRTW